MHHRFSFLFVLTTIARSLLANDTSLNDGRSGPEPLDHGRESPVRMVTEHIEVSFGYRDTDVHCTFLFHNTLATQPVVQWVGFPDVGAAAHEMARRDPENGETIMERVNTAPIRKMRTFVDGKRVKSSLRFGNVAPGNDHDGTAVWSFDERSGLRAWHTMRVTFPPGGDVKIERNYTVENGTTTLRVAFFHYTTATGAPWHGTIGRMQADITLKDGMTVDDLVWANTARTRDFAKDDVAQFTTQPARRAWEVIDARHLRLAWSDFEPRTEKNHRGFTLARPFHGW